MDDLKELSVVNSALDALCLCVVVIFYCGKPGRLFVA